MAAEIKCVLLKQPEQKSNRNANKPSLTPLSQKTVPKILIMARKLDHGQKPSPKLKWRNHLIPRWFPHIDSTEHVCSSNSNFGSESRRSKAWTTPDSQN